MGRYLFESKRLGFREWKQEDLEFFVEMNSKDTVMKYFTNTLTKEDSEGLLNRIMDHFDHHGYGLYATEIKESGQLIGFIGLQIATFYAGFTPCVEIGWRLDDRFWEEGYATEGAKVVLDYGFNQLNIEKIYSFTAKINKASSHVMEKIGLKYIEDFKHPKVKPESLLCDHVLYLLTKEQYNNHY